MGYEAKLLQCMAEEDGVTEEMFLVFASAVYMAAQNHFPSGTFHILMPRSGLAQPFGTEPGVPTQSELIRFIHHLRECELEENHVLIFDPSSRRQLQLAIRITARK